ncbi:MAG: hydrogenase expression/formation protein [Sedimenticola sp.]|nr:hydrogenase expression/formation protein [Sedimenticola sp.]
MSFYEIPAVTVGTGTQPMEEDGAILDYQEMPGEMATFSMPNIPEPEAIEGLDLALSLLARVQTALAEFLSGNQEQVFDLTFMDSANLDLIDQILGEGEVSVLFSRTLQVKIQESVMAGIWRVRYQDGAGTTYKDTLEVGSIPGLIKDGTFTGAATTIDLPDAPLPEGVLNAPPLVAELKEKSQAYRPGVSAHVINLTLLPQTEQDLGFLDQLLGKGAVTILSRGYGNCRITSTALQNVWWVQYFNSQDMNILNTLEVTEVPDVACAAQEDLHDSADRLKEILEVYQ